MTRVEWLQSTDLCAMLDALDGCVSDSKLRLFSCACCRVVWDLLHSDLQRRTVEYVEWFARGPGKDLQWVGTGNWQQRKLSQPIKQVQQTQGWAALEEEWHSHYAEMDPLLSDFSYDHCTPDMVTGFTLSLSYQFASCAARGAAVLRTAPSAYWLDAVEPRLGGEQEKQWRENTKIELAQCCDILRFHYGEPSLT
jgi:hypothetical protein